MITSYESDSEMWVMSNLAANRNHLRVVASCNLQLRGWCHISDSSLLVCLVEATSVAYQTAGSIEDVVIDLSQQEIWQTFEKRSGVKTVIYYIGPSRPDASLCSSDELLDFVELC
jgi:hypothetical protein